MTGVEQPRRADSVMPRQGVPDVSENKYDSQEVPVLIRLPDISVHQEALPGAPESQGRKYRRDMAETKSSGSRSAQPSGRSRRASETDTTVNTRVVVGGVLVGVVLVVALFLVNGRSSDSPEETAWPESAGELPSVVEGLEIEIPQNLTPDTAVAAETSEADSSTLLDPPELADVPFNLTTPETAERNTGSDNAMQANHTTTAWNKEPSTPLFPQGSSVSTGEKVQAWPSGLGQQDREHTSGEYRSSMNPAQDEIYRTGMLDRETSPADPPRGTILDGNIETPEQTSRR